MQPIYHCTTIPTDHLSPADIWDIHPFLPVDHPQLQTTASILRIGMIRPPLVIGDQESGYTFVTGQRCAAVYFASHTVEHVCCRVIAPDTPLDRILEVLYLEYSAKTPLTAIQLAYFYLLAERLIPESDKKKQLYTNLELPTAKYTIDRCLELLNLEEHLQLALFSQRLSEQAARELLPLDTTDRMAVFAMFNQLQLGGNKQRRCLQLLRDIAGRRNTSIASILELDELQEIVQHAEMNTPQKAQVTLAILTALYSPSLHGAQKEFNDWRKSLHLPDNCTIEPSQSFERDTLTLKITFNNKECFLTFWQEQDQRI